MFKEKPVTQQQVDHYGVLFTQGLKQNKMKEVLGVNNRRLHKIKNKYDWQQEIAKK